MKPTPEQKRQWYLDRKARKWPHIRTVAASYRQQNRDARRRYDKQRRLDKRAMCLVAAARIRARRKNVPFHLDEHDIARLQAVVAAGRCELSGVEFTLTGPRRATTPSLDRIDPTKGYVRGNVRIICQALNVALGNWGEDELRRIVLAWLAQATA